MDTTPKYIKMCEEAEEIQKKWNFEDGDFYLHRFPDKEGHFVGKEINMCLCPSCNVKDSHGDTHVNEYCPKGRNIWLPRQDQLQEIIDWEGLPVDCGVGLHFICNELIQFLKQNQSQTQQLNSMEQLWLAFIMKEKFNKIWDNKEETWT